MVRVYLGVGSNIDREHHLSVGLDALQGLFGTLDLSPVYDSAAVGFQGRPFLNLAVGADTSLPVGELAARLRRIEFDHGRPPDATRFSARTLDIDILTYADRVGRVAGVELPRGEILTNAFVLRPLSELAPGELHPVAGRSYAALWAEYDAAAQPLRRVEFRWGGAHDLAGAGTRLINLPGLSRRPPR